LNYTAQTLLNVGNRAEARDVVLLITDGASQDDVIVPSRILHATGALVRINITCQIDLFSKANLFNVFVVIFINDNRLR